MAWGRKKSGGRKEPRFGLAAALADLRLDPKDRIPTADSKPKKSAKRRSEQDDDLARRHREGHAVHRPMPGGERLDQIANFERCCHFSLLAQECRVGKIACTHTSAWATAHMRFCPRGEFRACAVARPTIERCHRVHCR